MTKRKPRLGKMHHICRPETLLGPVIQRAVLPSLWIVQAPAPPHWALLVVDVVIDVVDAVVAGVVVAAVVTVMMVMRVVVMTVMVVMVMMAAGPAPGLFLLLAVDLEAALERVGAEAADGRADEGRHEHPLVAFPVAATATMVVVAAAAGVAVLGRRVAGVPRRQPAHDGAQDADAQARVGRCEAVLDRLLRLLDGPVAAARVRAPRASAATTAAAAVTAPTPRAAVGSRGGRHHVAALDHGGRGRRDGPRALLARRRGLEVVAGRSAVYAIITIAEPVVIRAAATIHGDGCTGTDRKNKERKKNSP